MRPKSLLLLALALGCGLVASIGISQVMDRNSNSHAKLETTPIYVASHNINVGDAIDEKMVSLEEWPKGKVPHGAISSLETLKGRRPRAAIIEGEPILEAKLLEKGQMADPIRAISKGMRLYTIKVDAEKSAAGLLGPGDRVDVQLFVHKDQRNGVDTAKSKIILQNIRVFAVDQTVQRSADGSEEHSVAKTISLLLKPEQASKLALAAQIGEISLIPRNPDDESTASWSETTVDDLLGDGEKNSRAKEQGVPAKEPSTDQHSGLLSAIRAAAAPKPPFRMEIVKGAQPVEEALFDAESGRPIRPTTNESTGPSPHPSAAVPTTGAAAKSGAPIKPSDADKMLEDFPIDFGQPK
ncbi:MAG TPA: Flp pilus assembly protein CpaB [Lacipirellulaceae bacterium]|nr:Flp pilus assembly protein CpaB [Lacipirellulaceae bacterium]